MYTVLNSTDPVATVVASALSVSDAGLAKSCSLEAATVAAAAAAAASGAMSGQPSFRKGRWTPTEEAYTLRLMAEFKNGRLPPPIPEGTTLRQFLAQALNCDPLRISKKFAGAAQIGKVLGCLWIFSQSLPVVTGFLIV